MHLPFVALKFKGIKDQAKQYIILKTSLELPVLERAGRFSRDGTVNLDQRYLSNLTLLSALELRLV